MKTDETCPKCGKPAYGDWYYDEDEGDECFYVYCPECFEKEAIEGGDAA